MEMSVIVWLLLLTVGVAALGAAIAYGMRRNSARSNLEKTITEAATRREYEKEDRDRS
jgi:mannose/fructose/N-acetylgalactosamine-specific phosphotransferase system component IIC